MAESNTGGGGSVHWAIDVKGLKEQCFRSLDGRQLLTGADQGGRVDIDSFTVSIALPEGMDLDRFKDTLRSASGNRAEFDLLIRKDPKQITICWPDASKSKDIAR